MPREIIIEGGDARAAVKAVNALDPKRKWRVSIARYQERRSTDQNSLLHRWIGIIAKHTGDDPESLKSDLKDELCPYIEGVVGRVSSVNGSVHYKTSEMTVSQCSEFMELVEKWAWHFQNIRLPNLNDLIYADAYNTDEYQTTE